MVMDHVIAHFIGFIWHLGIMPPLLNVPGAPCGGKVSHAEQDRPKQHDNNQKCFYFHAEHQPEGNQASIDSLLQRRINIKRI